MKHEQAEELMAAYLAGDISTSEKDKLMAWVDEDPAGQQFFDEATNIWSAADDFVYPDFSTGKAAAFNRLEQRLDVVEERNAPTAKIRFLGNRLFRIAAAILFLAVAGWWWSNQAGDITMIVATTLAGERDEITLPDGTKVWLNEGSDLTYEDRADQRYLSFSGEAYFDVATDSLRPFQIYTGQAVTTVLGTAFNLRAYPDEPAVEVSVTEGKVTLERQAAPSETAISKVELEAGKVGVFKRSEAVVETIEETATNNVAWKEQVFNFSDVPLYLAIEDVERYFNVTIEVENTAMLDCPLQVSEFKNPTLEETIRILGFVMEFTVTQEGDKIRLSGGICH